ncbi:MAG: 5'-methylthioadenosine/adenosylhomocysteine nucleosidase, partial [Lachnospiraceae bacterium]|nr:5'-methylthioadenosine/adenosylhomocysteine nucleosidase [Lachnospiraceae bacterium]
MIGIIGALDVEKNELKEKLKNVKIETISCIDFFSGNFNEKNVVVAKCGVGKVFASMCAEIMI